MRDIIQRHNRLNGLVFSIVEFGFIALFVGAFAAYYLVHRRWVKASIGWGIMLNCLPVVIYGLCQLLQAKTREQLTGSYYSDRQAGEQHRRENPHMLRDTLILTVGTLLPFVTLAAVLFDVLRTSRR